MNKPIGPKAPGNPAIGPRPPIATGLKHAGVIEVGGVNAGLGGVPDIVDGVLFCLVRDTDDLGDAEGDGMWLVGVTVSWDTADWFAADETLFVFSWDDLSCFTFFAPPSAVAWRDFSSPDFFVFSLPCGRFPRDKAEELLVGEDFGGEPFASGISDSEDDEPCSGQLSEI